MEQFLQSSESHKMNPDKNGKSEKLKKKKTGAFNSSSNDFRKKQKDLFE